MSKGRYNQVANYALTQSEINIAIGDQAPEIYFKQLTEQCNGGPRKYGGITDLDEMKGNLAMNCIPEALLDGRLDYDVFLVERRKLMAAKVKRYFQAL